MSFRDPLNSINRSICEKINRQIYRRCLQPTSRDFLGHRFPTSRSAQEGMEFDGFNAFDLEHSSEHLAFNRLAHPNLASLAMLNRELLAKRYVRHAELDCYIICDWSQSMRYPLTRLYLGEQQRPVHIGQLMLGKPNLLKLAAGWAMMQAAQQGLRVRVVSFGAFGVFESPAVINKVDLHTYFSKIDKHFYSITPRCVSEQSQYAKVAALLSNRSGMFVFLGDFMDGAYVRQGDQRRTTALYELSALQRWATRRRLLVVRINHTDETRMPPDDTTTRGTQPHAFDDRCDDVEADPTGHSGDEPLEVAQKRLQIQQLWSATLDATLARRCRGFLSVNERNHTAALSRWLPRSWERLIARL